ncbi:MAG: hypothetical protein RMY62_006660 [Nostoc sp. ZfuVER08]|nr:hypothetical protein [Nostoc punctiforme]MDZ8015230.1 hypothetical protein [Nostoc sp. ZfuVER08]
MNRQQEPLTVMYSLHEVSLRPKLDLSRGFTQAIADVYSPN